MSNSGNVILVVAALAVLAVVGGVAAGSDSGPGRTAARAEFRGPGPGFRGGFHQRRGFRGRRGPGSRRGERLFTSFDANNDKALTQAEIDKVRADRLAKFDADKDGKLTLEEYEVLWLDAMRRRMVAGFQRLDEDGDAAVTVAEFAAPFAKLVDRLDQNRDGKVTRDDMARRLSGGRR